MNVVTQYVIIDQTYSDMAVRAVEMGYGILKIDDSMM